MADTENTSVLQNPPPTKLQTAKYDTKHNTKITRNRVKPPFSGVFRGVNRVLVIQK
jgi:hypothetical protein